MKYLTREVIDALFPEHGRTSCSDENTINGYAHYENGAARCHRCLCLNNMGSPLAEFVIEASIRVRQSTEDLRQSALAKLTADEKRALGL